MLVLTLRTSEHLLKYHITFYIGIPRHSQFLLCDGINILLDLHGALPMKVKFRVLYPFDSPPE